MSNTASHQADRTPAGNRQEGDIEGGLSLGGDRVQLRIEEGVAEVRLVRAEKHNGLDLAMLEALNEALDVVVADPEARVVVLFGEGKSFCSGLDLKSVFSDFDAATAQITQRREGEAENWAQRAIHGWRSSPLPVIAALQGACFGAGFQLALAADVRIAAPNTQISALEIQYGLIPDLGLSQTLHGLVRDDVARELVYSGRVVEAEEAERLGLITSISENPRGAARMLANEIAAKSPDAIRAAKWLLGEGPKLPVAGGLALEEELQGQLLVSLGRLAALSEPAGS
jgi:enoyl-CoA hydratase/carnithine racemase